MNSGTTTSCAKRPACIRSITRQATLPDSGSPNSIAHISPRPRTSLHGLVRLDERARQLEQARAETRRPLDEIGVVELAQGREPRRHREVVRREGRAVADRVLERVEHAVVHLL